jgi:hypothetical protein
MAEGKNVSRMNREELNAYATELGVEDAANEDKFKTNASLIEAIKAAEAERDKPAVQPTARPVQTASAESGYKGITYIVNGVRVDPNGKPVQ